MTIHPARIALIQRPIGELGHDSTPSVYSTPTKMRMKIAMMCKERRRNMCLYLDPLLWLPDCSSWLGAWPICVRQSANED